MKKLLVSAGFNGGGGGRVILNTCFSFTFIVPALCAIFVGGNVNVNVEFQGKYTLFLQFFMRGNLLMLSFLFFCSFVSFFQVEN